MLSLSSVSTEHGLLSITNPGQSEQWHVVSVQCKYRATTSVHH